MNLPLKKIASIQMGYTFRSRLNYLHKGITAVIQMKDLNDENIVECAELMRIDMDGVKERHLVKPGDVVFRSRGQVTTAAILSEDPGPAVVAAPLIRLRTANKTILPAYLAWYINQSTAQAFLSSRAKGTTQKMISKQALADLNVEIPPLERQQAIVKIAALALKEQQLVKRIAKLRKNYIAAKLMQTAKGE
jgi:hypothetical protein